MVHKTLRFCLTRTGSSNGNEASELFQGQIHLNKHTSNLISSMSLKCATDLGIPDAIHNHGKPMTLHELASALQIHPTKTSHLQRLLRLLTHNGFLATTNKEEEEVYLLTPPTKLLVRGNEPCLSPAVLGKLNPAWCDSLHSWKNWFHGEEVTLFESRHGVSLWDFLGQNQEVSNTFNEAIAAYSQMMRLASKEWKPVFEGLGTIVDVGGGTGTTARIISEAFPKLKCIVHDLPLVVANLSDSRNLSYIGGDMFKSIPPADAVLLKNVLHDWDDEHCIKVLKNCKEAVGKEGKVIIIELVIDEKNDDHGLTEVKLYFDITMMVLSNGKERNEKEWEKLFIKSGFSSYKIISTFDYNSIIQVYP